MVRVTFVMEQHIGHQTYYQNLRRAVDQDARIQGTWAPITYEGASQLLDRMPILPQSLRGTLQGMLQARQALPAVPYDVAFFNTQVPAALIGRQIRRKPYVIATDITPLQYDRMSHHYGHKPDSNALLAAYKHNVNVTLLRNAACVLPWSSWTADSLARDYGVNPANIEVVPPGVDLQRWTPGNQVESGPLRILFVGGDLYRKGGEILLNAFRSLATGTAELHLVTRTQIEPETGVHVHYGMQPNSAELIELYRSAHVFVLPTQAEAFGIAAIEASAAGLATIATRVGGLTDIVADGENGFLIDPGNATELKARLEQLADAPDLRVRFGRAARARAESRFNAQHNAARVITRLLEAAQRDTSATQRQVANRVRP